MWAMALPRQHQGRVLTGMSSMAYQPLLLILTLLLGFTNPSWVWAGTRPELMLPRVYQQQTDLSQFWVSEKLDGVRARWDGKQLVSRGGKVFSAPPWFTDGFPEQALDGELWLGRGQYEATVAIVNQLVAHEGWRKISFRVFDMPTLTSDFSGRVSAMRQLKQTPYLSVIEQFRVSSHKALLELLDTVVRQGGEGLILHRQSALYSSGRSDDLLKLKPFVDADAVVIGHKPGKGKFTGLLGSLKVRSEQGKTFYLGSGFTLAQRQNPPPIGSVVSYRYQGYTEAGIPRFAVFVRLRAE